MFIRLFYSTECKECMNLWSVIYNENISNMFIPICLDNFSSKKISQLKIKEIPAIVISCENKPSSIFEGPQQCSQWMTTLMYNRRKNICNQVEQQRNLIQKAQSEMRTQEGGTLEYIAEEMDGISDNYSYNMTELCQPKNFIPYGEEEKYNIISGEPIVVDDVDLNLRYQNLEKEILHSARNGTLEELQWAGGESLFSESHWRIMTDIVKNIHILSPN